MLARYERNIPALTEAECALLRNKRVLVVGCGGLGGHLIEFLARVGIGSVRVVDGDVFEPSNLNRQLLSEVPLLGVSKAKAAADRIARVNPDVALEAAWTISPAAERWPGKPPGCASPLSTARLTAGLPRRQSPCPVTIWWKHCTRRARFCGTRVF